MAKFLPGLVSLVSIKPFRRSALFPIARHRKRWIERFLTRRARCYKIFEYLTDPNFLGRADFSLRACTCTYCAKCLIAIITVASGDLILHFLIVLLCNKLPSIHFRSTANVYEDGLDHSTRHPGAGKRYLSLRWPIRALAFCPKVIGMSENNESELRPTATSTCLAMPNFFGQLP
jgi:hypothetical protein